MAAERPADPVQPNLQRWLPIRNADSRPIPPGGACRVTGVADDGALLVERPDTDGYTAVLFNGRVPVAVGGTGRATMTWPAIAAYDADPLDGEGPSHGESWGTEAGAWALQSGQDGFLVLGDGAGGLCNVVPTPPTDATDWPLADLGVSGVVSGGTPATATAQYLGGDYNETKQFCCQIVLGKDEGLAHTPDGHGRGVTTWYSASFGAMGECVLSNDYWGDAPTFVGTKAYYNASRLRDGGKAGLWMSSQGGPLTGDESFIASGAFTELGSTSAPYARCIMLGALDNVPGHTVNTAQVTAVLFGRNVMSFASGYGGLAATQQGGFVLRGAGGYPIYGVFNGTTYKWGYTGTLGTGEEVTGGIVTAPGGGASPTDDGVWS